MDTLLLAVATGGRSLGEAAPLVTLYVNGRRLVDLVRDVELPFAEREGHPDLAGNYVGLPAAIAFLPSRHLLGLPARGWDWGPGAVALGQCECGEPGCWPLLARITVGGGDGDVERVPPAASRTECPRPLALRRPTGAALRAPSVRARAPAAGRMSDRTARRLVRTERRC